MVEYKDTLSMPKTDFPMRGNLPTNEPKIQEKWNEMDINALVNERTKDRPVFVLHDGPPYANGDIHIGHARDIYATVPLILESVPFDKDAVGSAIDTVSIIKQEPFITTYNPIVSDHKMFIQIRILM